MRGMNNQLMMRHYRHNELHLSEIFCVPCGAPYMLPGDTVTAEPSDLENCRTWSRFSPVKLWQTKHQNTKIKKMSPNFSTWKVNHLQNVLSGPLIFCPKRLFWPQQGKNPSSNKYIFFSWANQPQHLLHFSLGDANVQAARRCCCCCRKTPNISATTTKNMCCRVTFN